MGLIFDCPAEKYHQDDLDLPCPSLNFGTAWKLLEETPAQAWAGHPKLGGAAPTPAEGDEAAEEDASGPKPTWLEQRIFGSGKMDLGSAAHAACLGRGASFQVNPHPTYQTKAARAWRAAVRAEGEIPISQANALAVDAMRREFMRAWHVDYAAVLPPFEDGHAEVVVTAKTRQGDPTRSMIDWLHIEGDFCTKVEYKTTGSLNAGRLLRLIYDYGYDHQDQFYYRALFRNGLMAASETRLILFQSTTAPYLTRLVTIPDEDVLVARIDEAERIWSECMVSGKWPGYPAEPFMALMPDWKRRQYERGER